jgi:nitrate/nitrite transporter NarK
MEVRWIGRRYAMVISAGLMGASLFLFRAVDNVAGFVGFNASAFLCLSPASMRPRLLTIASSPHPFTVEYFMQSAYAAILYASTPEYFPAPYRGSACGFAATLGRISGIVAPLIAQTIYSPTSYSVIYLAGGAALLSMLCVATIPVETRGKQTF